MDPVTVSTRIERPREEIFAYLSDISRHPEFTDHFLVDWRLTREDPVGRGAGARFRVKRRLQRFTRADATLVELDEPRRIVEAGRSGKFNRVRTRGIYDLEPRSGGTEVSYTMATRPVTISDRILDALGTRGFFKRRYGKALRRLRSILEDGEHRGRRATVAGRG